MIPYGKQAVDDSDVEAVVSALRSDWLTTGPQVEAFERAFADTVGAKYAVAVSNGTAALHTAMYALGIEAGDEVIVPTMTFAATANAVVFQGGTPVFADVDPDTLLLDPARLEPLITAKTKAIIAVDYAGQPCDYDALRVIAERHGLALVADACHAVGGRYKGRRGGSLADLNTFSLHPVKNMTTGEGGVVTTENPDLAGRMRLFRNHGITSDHRQREASGSWAYEMVDLGFNYRLTDFQCALGISQLAKLPSWTIRRQFIAGKYDEALDKIDAVSHLATRKDVSHAYHLYVIRVDEKLAGMDRDSLYQAMRQRGIGVNVHYAPVHLHPYYRRRFGMREGLCPVAEKASKQILSLPMYPGLTEGQQGEVVDALLDSIECPSTKKASETL